MSVSTWRRRPVKRQLGLHAGCRPDRDPDGLGGRLDRHHGAAGRRASASPSPLTTSLPSARRPTHAASACVRSLGPAAPPDQGEVAPLGRRHGVGRDERDLERAVAAGRGRQLAPLDQGHRVLLDQLGQGQIDHLVQRAGPVDVGVDEQPDRAALPAAVLAHQGEGGAGHRARHAERGGEALGEDRLARAEVAHQQNDVAGPAQCRHPARQHPWSPRATRSSTSPARSRSIRRHEALGPDEVGPHLGHGLAARPQHVGRVIRRDDVGPTPLEDLSAQLPDALGRLEQQLGGEVAQRDDHPRVDELDLLGQVRPARLDLLGRRVAVLGRPALDDVGDVALGPGQADLLPHEAVEQLARAADEGLAGQILLAARALAHEEQIGRRRAHPEHHLGPALGQRAERARRRGDAQPLEGVDVRHRARRAGSAQCAACAARRRTRPRS